MTLRNYSNVAPPLTLQTTVNNVATSLVVSSTAGYPAVPFTLAIERGTVNEEFCLCTAIPDSTHFTVTRGYDGSTAVAHTGGLAVIEHAIGAIDYREANAHMEIGSHYSEPRTFVATAGAAQTCNFRTGNNWDFTLSQALTIAISNPPPSGQWGTLFIVIRNGGTAYAVTWPASVKWAGGSAPALSGINLADLITLVTFDGGVTYAGMVTQNFASLGGS
jgi:hypothetical protein